MIDKLEKELERLRDEGRVATLINVNNALHKELLAKKNSEQADQWASAGETPQSYTPQSYIDEPLIVFESIPVFHDKDADDDRYTDGFYIEVKG